MFSNLGNLKVSFTYLMKLHCDNSNRKPQTSKPQQVFQKRKQKQLQVLKLLQQRLKNHYLQKSENIVALVQNNEQTPKSQQSQEELASDKQNNQHSQGSQSSEYEYAEDIEPVFKRQKVQDQMVRVKGQECCLDDQVQGQQNYGGGISDDQWTSLQQKFGEIEKTSRSKKQQKNDKIKVKIQQQAFDNVVSQKLQEHDQPLSPPSTIPLIPKTKNSFSKNSRSEILPPRKQSSLINNQNQKHKQIQVQKKKRFLNLLKKKQSEVFRQADYPEDKLVSSQPSACYINQKKHNLPNANPKTTKQHSSVRLQSSQITQTASPKQKSSRTIQNNLNQIYKLQKKQKQEILKQLKNSECAKTKLKAQRFLQKLKQDKQKFERIKSLAKIFIESEHYFRKLKIMKKNGSIPLHLKTLNVTEHGNLCTLIIKRTVRQIQYQLTEKCKLQIEKLDSRQLVLLRGPLLKSKQSMPACHSSTFLAMVGYSFELNLTLPPQKDIIALYQYMLITLQTEMTLKEGQKQLNFYDQQKKNEVSTAFTDKIQKHRKTKQTPIKSIFKNVPKPKKVKKKKNTRKQYNLDDDIKLLQQLQKFIQNDKKLEKN